MLDNLYEKNSTFKLKVFGEGSWWIVSLTDPVGGDKRPDCVVNHPRKRIGFRTMKGLKVEKYGSLDELVWDIKEEGKKYGIRFRKYKVIKYTVAKGRKVVKGGKIIRKIEVQKDNLDKIMRVICNGNNLDYSYKVRGFIYGNEFVLDSVMQNPIPLASVSNEGRNFSNLKRIVTSHYAELKEFDYKNRGYKYFTGSSSEPEADGFLVPLKWFDYIQYCA